MRDPSDMGDNMGGAAPAELAIPSGASATAGSVEVLRAWIVDGGLHVSLLPAFETPDMWGLLLADIARHAARSFAAEKRFSEEQAMQSIVELLVAELEQPTDVGTTEPIKPQ